MTTAARCVAIYARVSTDEQAAAGTIQSQLYRCREYAQRQGWEVVAEFKDEGVSGSVAYGERPEGRRLLDVASDGLFTTVLALCVDRLSRDLVDASLVRKELEGRGAPLEFVLQSFDGTPEGELQFNIFASFAQYERKVIGRRTNDGKKRAVRKGRYMASVTPYGYVRDDDGSIQPHPEQATVVRRVFELSRDGVGLRAIADRLNDEGIPSPSNKRKSSAWGWHFTTVSKILKARRYIGEATYSGEAMSCTPLIDAAMFNAVQTAMAERKRLSARNTKHFYLLQHRVRCRHCGSGFQTRTTRTGLKLYQCHQRVRYGKRAGHEGIKWSWHCDELDAKVKEAVREFILRPEQVLARVEIEVRRFKQELSTEGDRLLFLERRLSDLDEEEKRVLSWARKGIIDDAQMQQQLQEIRTERWTANAQIGELRKVADQAAELADAADLFRELAASLPVAGHFVDEETGDTCEPTDEQWRDMIAGVVETVWIEQDGSVTLEGPLTDAAKEEGAQSGAPGETSVSPPPR